MLSNQKDRQFVKNFIRSLKVKMGLLKFLICHQVLLKQKHIVKMCKSIGNVIFFHKFQRFLLVRNERNVVTIKMFIVYLSLIPPFHSIMRDFESLFLAEKNDFQK